jgi:DNA-directed RNA polymerase specialized sigma24 family protein
VNALVRQRADGAQVTSSYSPALARLDLEWHRLNRRPACVRHAASWGVLDALDSLDDVVLTISRGTGDDEVLRRLVVLAANDDLAARVVLQRLLPGMVRVAARWARRKGGWADAFDEVLAAGWMVVRTHGDDARPQFVARLLRYVEYHAFLRGGRRGMVVVPMEVSDRAAAEPADPLSELVEVVRSAHRVLTEHDRCVLRLLLRDCSPPEMAAELGVSIRTVTNHRHVMVRRLQDAVFSP